MIFLCVPSSFIFMDEVFLFPVDWPRIIWIVWYRKLVCVCVCECRPTKEDQSLAFHPVAVNLIIFMFVPRFRFSNRCAGHFLLVFFISNSSVLWQSNFFSPKFCVFSLRCKKFIFFSCCCSKRTLIDRINIESTKVYTAFEVVVFSSLFEFARIWLKWLRRHTCAMTISTQAIYLSLSWLLFAHRPDPFFICHESVWVCVFVAVSIVCSHFSSNPNQCLCEMCNSTEPLAAWICLAFHSTWNYNLFKGVC